MNKRTVIKAFRLTPAENERYKVALAADGRDMSEICRATLERIAAKLDRRNAEPDRVDS